MIVLCVNAKSVGESNSRRQLNTPGGTANTWRMASDFTLERQVPRTNEQRDQSGRPDAYGAFTGSSGRIRWERHPPQP